MKYDKVSFVILKFVLIFNILFAKIDIHINNNHVNCKRCIYGDYIIISAMLYLVQIHLRCNKRLECVTPKHKVSDQ